MRPLIFAALLAPLLIGSAMAQEVTPSTPPSPGSGYQDQLFRLSEILGALHLVRPLCEPSEEGHWRDRMMELIRLERPSTEERNTMIERFNSGYADAKARYSSCTDAARAAAANLAREGQTISRGLAQTVDQANTH